MTASVYMQQAMILNHKIDRKLVQLKTLKEMATRTTAALQEDPVSHTRNVASMQDLIVKAIDLEKEIDGDIDRLADLKAEQMEVINQIDDPDLQSILEQRYVAFSDWNRISASMGYSGSYIYKLHKRALEKVESVLARPPASSAEA